MNSNCPACEHILGKIILDDVVLDVCQGGCAGIWFDKDEILKFDEKTELEGQILLNLKRNSASQITFKNEKYCPKCINTKLSRQKYEETNIMADKCPKCEGIWLDYKELSTIRDEHLAKNENPEKQVYDTLRKLFRG